jgi:hypothetical protein
MKKIVTSLIPLTFALMLSIGVTTQSSAAPPECEPLCVTSPCTQNSDCTAAPGGRCDFVCPQKGCCVYD